VRRAYRARRATRCRLSIRRHSPPPLRERAVSFQGDALDERITRCPGAGFAPTRAHRERSADIGRAGLKTESGLFGRVLRSGSYAAADARASAAFLSMAAFSSGTTSTCAYSGNGSIRSRRRKLPKSRRMHRSRRRSIALPVGMVKPPVPSRKTFSQVETGEGARWRAFECCLDMRVSEVPVARRRHNAVVLSKPRIQRALYPFRGGHINSASATDVLHFRFASGCH